MVDGGHLNLTEEEKEVLDHLKNAWNAFMNLDNKHPSDNSEFQRAIHLAQQKIGMRIARRADPDMWRTGE